MDFSTKSPSNLARFQTDNVKMNDRNVNVDPSQFSPQAPNIDGRIGNLLDGLLIAITGSSNAYADDVSSQTAPESQPPQATSRYTGNTCDFDGAVKSIAENGLAAGAGGLVC